MIITYYGVSCFKLQSGDTSLVFDLPSKRANVKPPRFRADIMLQSHDHDNHNGAKDILSEADQFIIDGPGEYEVKGIYIAGAKSYHDSSSGKENGVNTVFRARFEDINFCFLGDFGEKDLRPDLKEALGKIDVLFVPIGGNKVLDIDGARNIIAQLEPAIAIPMHYGLDDKSESNNLKSFLNEFGVKEEEVLEKLSLKKKDINSDAGTKIVALSPV